MLNLKIGIIIFIRNSNKMAKCVHCKCNLINFIDLKKIPIVNNFSNKRYKKFKTKISICKNCKLFQHEKIFE